MDVKQNKGMTLIEVTLAMVILVVGILSALMIIITCVQQREVSHEMDLAKNAVVAKLQEIRAFDFDTIHAQYNEVDGPRRFFTINELMPVPGIVPPDTHGFTDVDNTNSELLEIIVNVQWLSVTQAEQNLAVRSMVTRKE